MIHNTNELSPQKYGCIAWKTQKALIKAVSGLISEPDFDGRGEFQLPRRPSECEVSFLLQLRCIAMDPFQAP